MERGGAGESGGGDQAQGVLTQVEGMLPPPPPGDDWTQEFKMIYSISVEETFFVCPSGVGPAHRSLDTRTADAITAENEVTVERARRGGRRGEEGPNEVPKGRAGTSSLGPLLIC